MFNILLEMRIKELTTLLQLIMMLKLILQVQFIIPLTELRITKLVVVQLPPFNGRQ